MIESPTQRNTLRSRLFGRLVGNERGAVLVLVAAGMIVLAGFGALGIDVGRLYTTRGEIQNGADAAALAGAQGLFEGTDEASDRAYEWAEKNGLTAEEVTEVEEGITCEGELVPDTLTVRVSRNVNFVFAQLLGIMESDVVSCATARMGSPAQLNGLLPLSVRDEDINDYPLDTVLKMDSPPSNGNTQALAFDATGANEFLDNLRNGSTQEVCAAETDPENLICTVNSEVDTEPGVVVGKTREGIEWRMNNTSANCDTFDEAFLLREDGHYGIRSGCNPFQGDSGSKRVVAIPVIDELCDGRCEVTVLRFAIFWLEGFGPGGCSGGNRCEITGKYVPIVGEIGGKFGSLDTNSGIVTVRLVE
jgi:Flp pilus assembly protein TadG